MTRAGPARLGLAAALISALLAGACVATGTVEAIRSAPASDLDPALPAVAFETWLGEVMHPTAPRWREVPCAPRRCVEAFAARSNGLSFGVVVETRATGGPRFRELFLELEGTRRRFGQVQAWAIAVAGLAPKPSAEGGR